MVVKLIKQGTGFEDFKKALQYRAQQSKQMAGTKTKIVSNAEYSGFVDQGTKYMAGDRFFTGTIERHNLSEIGPDPTTQKIRQYAQKIATEIQGRAKVDTGNLRDNVKVEG
jgi:hypothetical protein